MLFSILQRDDDALGHQFRRQSQVFQQLITPSIRPVDTLLMTNAEKREVARIAFLMACVL